MNKLEFKLKKPFETLIKRQDGTFVKVHAKNIDEWTEYIVRTTAEFVYSPEKLKEILEFKPKQGTRMRLPHHLFVLKQAHILLCHHFGCRAGNKIFSEYRISRLDYYNNSAHPKYDAIQLYESLLPLVKERIILDFTGIRKEEPYFIANEYMLRMFSTAEYSGSIVIYDLNKKEYKRYKIDRI
jgi:hypothetical protein